MHIKVNLALAPHSYSFDQKIEQLVLDEMGTKSDFYILHFGVPLEEKNILANSCESRENRVLYLIR